MKTITDVKDDLVNHLYSIDKAKLSMMDLKIYCEIVKIADDLGKPDPFDSWKDALKTLNSGFSGFGGNYKPVEMKEG